MRNHLFYLFILVCVAFIAAPSLPSRCAQQTAVGEMTNLLGVKRGLNLNSATTDFAIPVSAPKYIIRRVVLTNPSTSMAISAATVGLFTATGGGGTTIVAAATFTGLTGSSKFADATIAVTADTLTAQTLYARIVIAHGSALTVDMYVFGDPLY